MPHANPQSVRSPTRVLKAGWPDSAELGHPAPPTRQDKMVARAKAKKAASGKRSPKKARSGIPAPKKAAPRKNGRPAFKPTPAQRKQVESLVGYGLRQDQIGSMITKRGINVTTLRKYFKNEIRLGGIKALALVTQTLFQRATGRPAIHVRELDGSLSLESAAVEPKDNCLFFWLERRGGPEWRRPEPIPRFGVALEDKAGEPIKGRVVLWLPDNERDPDLPTET